MDEQISAADLELIRLWFEAVQDANRGYLERRDFELAERIYLRLGRRVPHSILRHTDVAPSAPPPTAPLA